MLPLNVLRHGVEAEEPAGVVLRAGPLTAVYAEGGLRGLRLGGTEIVRRVYVAVRDRNWGTVAAALSEVTIERGERDFRVGFLAEHRQGAIDFAWRGSIAGGADGTIAFAMDGAARADFLRNRIGFCVLHPPGPCAGAPCVVEHNDGSRTEGVFPLLISPDQPFVEMRAIAHEVAPGLWAEVRFAGDIFEMEDQRNWTDDSYKTYCTPLRLPFPAPVAAGERVAQAVTLRLRGDVPPAADEATGEAPPMIAVGTEALGTLPALGLGLASAGAALTRTEAAWLRALRPAHLRVDLPLAEGGWRATLQRAVAEAGALGAALEAAIFLSARAEEELAALAAALRDTGGVPVARWLVFGREAKVTPPGLVAAARRALADLAPRAAFGGGTNAYFTELNRARPDPAGLDLLAYSVNPQVHAFDDASIIETLAAQGATVASARAFAGGLPLAITPITLRPRFNPDATGAAAADSSPEIMPEEVDPRQMSLRGAAWTLGSLAALAAAGVASATFYETTGPRGTLATAAGAPWPAFRDIPGGVYPLYHVLADAGGLAGGEVLPVAIGTPGTAAALAVRKEGHLTVLVANLRPARQRIVLALDAPRVAVRILDERNAEDAMRAPELFRAEDGTEVAVIDGRIALDLLPYAVARVVAE